MPYKNLHCKTDDWVPLERSDTQESAGGMCDYCGHHFADKAEFTVHVDLAKIDAERRTPPKVPPIAPEII